MGKETGGDLDLTTPVFLLYNNKIIKLNDCYCVNVLFGSSAKLQFMIT
jgi:hypothetical protein